MKEKKTRLYTGGNWYHQRRDLRNQEALCDCGRVNFPFPFRVLAYLSGLGRDTRPLRKWLKTAELNPRDKGKFVDWLAKLISYENDLLGVEPFDVEAAKKPLKESGEIPITIYSTRYLFSIERERGKAEHMRCSRYKSNIKPQQSCIDDDANSHEENEDSSGKDRKTCRNISRVDKKRLSPAERESLKEQKNENPYDYL